jgi:hypothetical protein
MKTFPINRCKVGSTVYVPCVNALVTIVLCNECRCRVKIHRPDKLVRIGEREFVAADTKYDNWCLSVPVVPQ